MSVPAWGYQQQDECDLTEVEGVGFRYGTVGAFSRGVRPLVGLGALDVRALLPARARNPTPHYLTEDHGRRLRAPQQGPRVRRNAAREVRVPERDRVTVAGCGPTVILPQSLRRFPGPQLHACWVQTIANAVSARVSQNVISIARYISAAMTSSPWAASRRSVRWYRVPLNAGAVLPRARPGRPLERGHGSARVRRSTATAAFTALPQSRAERGCRR